MIIWHINSNKIFNLIIFALNLQFLVSEISAEFTFANSQLRTVCGSIPCSITDNRVSYNHEQISYVFLIFSFTCKKKKKGGGVWCSQTSFVKWIKTISRFIYINTPPGQLYCVLHNLSFTLASSKYIF